MTSQASVHVRPVEARDRGRWESLFLAYGVFYEEDFPPATIAGVWTWLMTPDHPVRCFVAELEGHVVGFAHLRFQHDTFTAGAGWFLDDLFTDPVARGQGVGRALITALDVYATQHGGGTLRWITAADNERARGLYDTLATSTTWVTYEREVGQ
jgi:GNAT superfamily N-acetyltransferase